MASANESQPNLFPSCVDCASNSSIARIELNSDGTGAICKAFHLHVGCTAATRHGFVPNMTNLIPAVAADGFRNCVESEVGNTTTRVRVHARFVLRILNRLPPKAVLGSRISHVT